MDDPETMTDNISDITKYKNVKEVLQESEQKYRALAESRYDAICILDRDGLNSYANRICTKFFGKKPAELIGKRLADFFPAKEAKQMQKDLQCVFRKKCVVQRDYAAHFHNHLRHFSMMATPILDDKKKVISAVVTTMDITGRKKLEEDLQKTRGAVEAVEKEKLKVADTLRKRVAELEKAYAELQDSKDELVRSEKLASTGRIAASIAHELRNPLANVTMSLQQVRKTFKPEDARFRYIDLIMRNLERINFLITELLNSARPPKLKMRPYDIHKVLKSVLELTKSKRRVQHIKLVKKLTSKNYMVRLDKEQIERTFLNLVNNAIEAMPKKGTLTIITELKENIFAVKIQDTGKGIPEKDIIRIYDPFFSSKPDGIGMGLNICYGIIVSHGGTIEVKSKPRKGSLFTVSLPIE